MIHKNNMYKVTDIGIGLRESGYKQFVPAGTIVKALEDAPADSWDIVDVLLPDGSESGVYSFQLEKRR